jgi:hypothetical protein
LTTWSKGGAEHTVEIAKADLVPTTADLLPVYASFAELADACFEWEERVNARPHRETGAPVERLRVERGHLHVLPIEPRAGAAKHYDEDQLAALVSLIALINACNRVNVIVQQPAGDYETDQSDNEGRSDNPNETAHAYFFGSCERTAS